MEWIVHSASRSHVSRIVKFREWLLLAIGDEKRKLEQKAIEGPPARRFSLLVTSDNKENTRGEARERRGCRSSCRPIEFGLLYKSVEREPRVSDHRVFLYTRRILHSRPEAIPIESSNVSLYYEPPAFYSLLPVGNNNLCSMDFINWCDSILSKDI